MGIRATAGIYLEVMVLVLIVDFLAEKKPPMWTALIFLFSDSYWQYLGGEVWRGGSRKKFAVPKRADFSLGVPCQNSYFACSTSREPCSAASGGYKTHDATPSLAQAIKMKKFMQEGKLTDEVIQSIMQEDKPNQKEKPAFKDERIG